MALAGNRHAEKWTYETVVKELAKINKEAKSYKCNYLLTALVNAGLTRKTWEYWKVKFDNDTEEGENVLGTMAIIEEMIESKLVERGLSGEVQTTIAALVLKCKHKFIDEKDKQANKQIEQLGNNIIVIKSNNLTEED